jgi:hypothetical protein
MNNSHGTSQTTANTPAYYASVTRSQASGKNLSKERAQRLYAIGELKAAAQVLADLAAGRPRRRVTDRAEAAHG